MDTARPARSRTREVPKWAPVAAAAVLLVLIAIGIWAYASSRPQPVLAARRDVVAQIQADGTVVMPPSAQAVVHAPYRAPVERVYASLNQTVQQGDLLVELDLPSAEAAVASATQALESAREALQTARQTAEERVRAAEQRLQQAQAAERQARASQPSAGTSGFGSHPGVTGSAPPTGETSPGEAGTSPDAAVQERRAAERALAQAQAQMADELRPYQEAVQRAQRALAAARRGEMQGLVRAPVSGVVTALNAVEGAVVGESAQVPLAVITNYDRLQIHVPLKKDQASKVTAGTPAQITVPNQPDRTFPGEVLYVTTAASRTGEVTGYTAVLGFQNPGRAIKPDQTVRVSIKLGEARHVVAVPAEAVQTNDQGQTVVEVKRDGRWQQVPVQVGLSDGEYTEVREGLREGEPVRVTPSPID